MFESARGNPKDSRFMVENFLYSLPKSSTATSNGICLITAVESVGETIIQSVIGGYGP